MVFQAGTSLLASISSYSTPAGSYRVFLDATEEFQDVNFGNVRIPHLSVSDVSVVEGDVGDTPVDVTVHMTGSFGTTVTVDYQTEDGSAYDAESDGVLPEPPNEDFHVYLLDQNMKVIRDLAYPYSTIKRTAEMRWYTLPVPSVEVPKRFSVALSFNPHRTKGVYLGMDKGVKESHSYVGLPETGF